MNQSYLKTKLFLILLLLFCLPLLYPGLELFIIYGQIALIVPLYLLLNFSTSSDFVKVQIVIFFFLTLLALVGMPGSIIGWMGMVCCGYLFGTRAARSQIKARKELTPFIYCSIIVSFTVLLRNARENFSYELLSDYFSSSSINTVPILAGVSFNLYCALSFYRLSRSNQRSGKLTKKEVLILFTLGVLGILTTIVFDFRSGFLTAFTVTLL
ncbi:hypothetical protein N9208_07035, partial [Akkermansiaceae bacterium]|nr:hypothetical protein [Akkermansiaceae bacterium]